MTAWWLLWGLLATPAAPAAEWTAHALLEQLGLPEVAGFRRNDPVAIVATSTDAVVAERLAGRLRQVGVERVLVLPAPGRGAVDLGARWILSVERSGDRLMALLRQADGGLWQPPEPGIFASATISSGTGNGLEPPSDTVGPVPAPGLYGPPQRLGALPGRPLAMTRCPGQPTIVMVLTRTHLFRVSLSTGWAVVGQRALDGLRRHPMPSRFPMGIVRCTAQAVAFGTSDLAEGHELDPRSLEPRRVLPGAPLARRGDEWVLGNLHEGQAVWKGPDDRLVWSYPGESLDIALTVDGVLRRGEAALTPSGLGASVLAQPSGVYWVRTGLGPWGGTDEVQLGVDKRPLGEVLAVSGPVRATVLSRFAAEGPTLLVAIEADGRTSVMALRVVFL